MDEVEHDVLTYLGSVMQLTLREGCAASLAVWGCKRCCLRYRNRNVNLRRTIAIFGICLSRSRQAQAA